MHKFCEKLHLKLVHAGFDAEIHEEDFIIFKSPFKSTPTVKNYYVRLYKNKVLVFTVARIADILADTYPDKDLAYALSQKIDLFGKDGVTVYLKEGSLIISSIFNIGVFTSVKSLYNRVYDAMIKCHLAFNDVVTELERNKKT